MSSFATIKPRKAIQKYLISLMMRNEKYNGLTCSDFLLNVTELILLLISFRNRQNEVQSRVKSYTILDLVVSQHQFLGRCVYLKVECLQFSFYRKNASKENPKIQPMNNQNKSIFCPKIIIQFI